MTRHLSWIGIQDKPIWNVVCNPPGHSPPPPFIIHLWVSLSCKLSVVTLEGQPIHHFLETFLSLAWCPKEKWLGWWLVAGEGTYPFQSFQAITPRIIHAIKFFLHYR